MSIDNRVGTFHHNYFPPVDKSSSSTPILSINQLVLESPKDNKTMATIFDLLNELMDEGGIDLNEDYWLALRMTCQKLNDKCREYHLNSKYTHRRALLVQESMENLAKISQHSSKVNLRVQYLDISCLSPYSLEHGFYNYNPWQGGRTSLTDEELKMMAAVQKFDREHHKQIEGPSPDPSIMIAPLIQALQNLPNLQEELDLGLEYVVRLDDEFKEEVITLPESRMFSSLRKLRLAGFKIDVENLKVFLIHCKQSLKEFTLDQLVTQDPEKDCFEFLNDNFKLELFKIGFPDYPLGFDDWEFDDEEFERQLPSLEALGNWSSKSMVCTIQGQSFGGDYYLEKHLWRELSTYDSPNRFWTSITEGNWGGSEGSDGEWGTSGEIVIEENDGGRFHFDSDDERYYSG
ncbi:hypothetical protein TWF703_004717 [Orbilia oligospora]|uniref:Uncharacterized protein n=2 Tax=Orbilia oligospora TaxID=2813651 RepID=A0A7C8NWW7_ORBOL|nr:hypothetical protein TWF703_004717 [Orbilia oligospora]